MSYRGVFRQDLFQNKNIVVTGGGSGIGRTIALELAQLGASVGLIGRNLEKLNSVQSEIKKAGRSAYVAVADIREASQVQAAVSTLLKDMPVIHALVNNAGGQYFSPLQDITANGFDAVVRTNLHGTFQMMQELFKQSLQKNGGAIVNILASFHSGMPMMAHSGAARAGADNLTKTAAFEWAQFGVRVNAVAPGYINSSGLEKYDEEAKKWIPRLKNHVPLKRMGTESEVSSAVMFLLSPAANYINGVTLSIDGGASLAGAPWPLADIKESESTKAFSIFEGEK